MTKALTCGILAVINTCMYVCIHTYILPHKKNTVIFDGIMCEPSNLNTIVISYSIYYYYNLTNYYNLTVSYYNFTTTSL